MKKQVLFVQHLSTKRADTGTGRIQKHGNEIVGGGGGGLWGAGYTSKKVLGGDDPIRNRGARRKVLAPKDGQLG